MRVEVRPAVAEDVDEILALVRELAAFEGEPDAVQLTEDRLHAQLFGPEPRVFALVAPAPDGAGRRLDGMALWYLTYSTWEGSHGIHLEDLCVRQDARGRGVGSALLAGLAAIAVERGLRRLEWQVLDWNRPAIDFYLRHGSRPLGEWVTHRVDGDALDQLARRG